MIDCRRMEPPAWPSSWSKRPAGELLLSRRSLDQWFSAIFGPWLPAVSLTFPWPP